MSKQHFIFDVDDTLTDAYTFNQQMFVDTFSKHLNLEDKTVVDYLRSIHFCNRGVAMIDQFKTVCEKYSLSTSPSKLVSDNELLHQKNIEQVNIFESTVDFIRLLKLKGKQLSICSNRQTKSLNKILDKYNLSSYFSNIVSCVDEGHEKPDPTCLLAIISKSNLPKKEFIYFGDSKTDYQFAKNAGIDSLIIDHYLNNKQFYKLITETLLS